MVVLVTGITAGMLKRQMAKSIQRTVIAFTSVPHLPRLKGASFTSLRPLSKEMATGRAYEVPRQMTPTPLKALNAAEEPRYRSPRRIWIVVERRKAFRGTESRVSLTREKM